MGEIHPSITLLPSSGNELPVESKFFTEFKTKIAAIFSDIMLSFKILGIYIILPDFFGVVEVKFNLLNLSQQSTNLHLISFVFFLVLFQQNTNTQTQRCENRGWTDPQIELLIISLM